MIEERHSRPRNQSRALTELPAVGIETTPPGLSGKENGAGGDHSSGNATRPRHSDKVFLSLSLLWPHSYAGVPI